MACAYESAAAHDDHSSGVAFSCDSVTNTRRSLDSLVKRDEVSAWRFAPCLGAAGCVGLGLDCGVGAERTSGCSSTSSLHSDCSAEPPQVSVWDDVDGASEHTILNGDVVQIVSVASRVNDGVLISRDDELTASGYICRQGTTNDSAVKAFFHCHEFGEPAGEGEDGRLFLLLPVSRTATGTFTCPVKDVKWQKDPVLRMLPVLAVSETEGVRRLELKCVDPLADSTQKATDCRWRVAALSGDASSRLWRMSAEVDRGGVYAAVDCTGQPFATQDESLTDVSNDGLENPQTFFYLYRKFKITEDGGI